MEKRSCVRHQLTDEKGLVGIGTLIIFIALILVSAVAAGVIIRTSGQLRQQARNTGEEAIRDISTGIKILGSKGRPNGENIDNAEILVRLRAGSPGINLSEAILQYVSEDISKHLEMGEDSGNNYMAYDSKEDLEAEWDQLESDEFATVKIRKDDPKSDNYSLSKQGTLASIWINIAKIENEVNGALQEGESAKVVIMPKSGVETRAGFIVPSSIVGKTVVEL